VVRPDGEGVGPGNCNSEILFLRGEVAGMSIDDLAGEVIQQELNEQKTMREKAKGEPA
jgi:hypothetical protein